MKNVNVVENENGRFVVTDRETGAMLDDCQGYGYKSADAAYRCYGWKNAKCRKK